MVKVFYLPKLAWSLVFFSIQIIDFLLIRDALNNRKWFTQDWSNHGLMFTFEGDLIGPKVNINICEKGDTYSDCYDECDEYCDRFQSWYIGGTAYRAFGVAALILTVLIAAVLILDVIKLGILERYNKYFHVFYTSILMIFVLFLHFLAYTVWAGTVKLRFDNCSHEIDYKGAKTVCGLEGPKKSLKTLIWLFGVTPVYVLISFKIFREEKRQVRSESEENIRFY